MKKIKFFNLITAMIVAVMLVVLSFAPNSYAAEGIDVTTPGSLTLVYQYDGRYIEGVHAHIYKIANVTENIQFELVAPFNDSSKFPITDLNEITTQEQWLLLANDFTKEVAGYIYVNNIAPDYEGVSDANGEILFDNIPCGIYLVFSDPYVDEAEDCTYSFTNFFTSIPGYDETGDLTHVVRDVITQPKCEKTANKGDLIDYSVYKRWVDDGNEQRPRSITIQIYKDGKLTDKVTLDDSNNWQFNWQGDVGSTYTVSEIETGNYTMSLTEREHGFELTNTLNTPPKKPDTPPDTPDTPPDTPDTPDSPVVPGVLGAIRKIVPSVLGANRLPQTGQLWWPVPILAVVGIIAVGLGIRSEKKRKNKN